MATQIVDIKGYAGMYQIASDGRIYSPKGRKATEITNTGYERVSLWKDGKGKHFFVHRLVALAFIPNPNGYEYVNHKDGNKRNNNMDNLEWCSASQNMKHAYEHNLLNIKTTRVVQLNKSFEKIKEWESIKEACDSLGLNHANIVTVCGQKTNRKLCGGFIWRYANDI